MSRAACKGHINRELEAKNSAQTVNYEAVNQALSTTKIPVFGSQSALHGLRALECMRKMRSISRFPVLYLPAYENIALKP